MPSTGHVVFLHTLPFFGYQPGHLPLAQALPDAHSWVRCLLWLLVSQVPYVSTDLLGGSAWLSDSHFNGGVPQVPYVSTDRTWGALPGYPTVTSMVGRPNSQLCPACHVVPGTGSMEFGE